MKRWNSSGVSSLARHSTRAVFSHSDQDWEENLFGKNAKFWYPILYRTIEIRKACIRWKENVLSICRQDTNTHIMASFHFEKMESNSIALSSSAGLKPNEIRRPLIEVESMIGFARMFRYLIFSTLFVKNGGWYKLV